MLEHIQMANYMFPACTTNFEIAEDPESCTTAAVQRDAHAAVSGGFVKGISC